jgi:TrmH family RNA methyltransferase
MMISRSRLKYLSSLKIKKLRDEHRQFIMEGDKIVSDMLKDGNYNIRQIIASKEWLTHNNALITTRVEEVTEADPTDLQRISSLETPPPVMAVLELFERKLDLKELSDTWCIALDTIQDPGNLGTIIRSADWFGISHIICNKGCADCFSPKVIQASMGAILRVNVYYEDLASVLEKYTSGLSLPVYGTFMDGTPVYNIPVRKKGMVVFGNESRGISADLIPYIQTRITVPPGNQGVSHVESLNVASAAAVVCSVISHSYDPDMQ